jgi:hypothetical protein
MTDRFELPQLRESDGTIEQLAQRRAAHAIAFEVQRLEDDERVSGWERMNRPKAFDLAARLRRIANELFTAGTRGLETQVAYERARMHGFPCEKCGHQHESSRFSFRCFRCECAEWPRPPLSGR